ncbi:hypothetical protein D0T53_06175 [Dysgonomonas sp. 216]|uniref:glycoside hydrolase family 10 protein n=1 Tax=Dysgonomonas sp. 216 TaxID=2302934 RepID=UPI0013D1530F|nr:family 10 glycosylhydrolase [Dysgonomonas sp. 216]NDW18500.1 hypothetical protein [Dysgonomonas sp. 216]
MKSKPFFLFIFFCFIAHSKAILIAQNPTVEVRAVWLSTMWGLDWPTQNISSEKQKEELCSILDRLKASNFNTVFFQARLRGDTFYFSDIEPFSRYANQNFDPLAFAIEECHRRGLECHAWFVTYPLGNKKHVSSLGLKSVVKKKPEICKLYNGEWYLDPGNPETRQYILSLVDEIVKKYDIDGIHFDYIRYPEKANRFPDSDNYKRYGKGLTIEDWRRNNISILVSEVYDSVKKNKPWVQVSSSPIGLYKNLESGGGVWTAYSSVFQDAGFWLKNGKHDAIYPMMYYKDNLFYPYLEDWLKNSNGRIVAPGLGAYRLLPAEQNWTSKDITDQIDFSRKVQSSGQAFFRTANVVDNLKGLGTSLSEKYYKHPAKLPAMRWLNNSAPNSPVNLQVYSPQKGKLILSWLPSDSTIEQNYTVYYSDSEDIDINDPRNILVTGIRSNQITLNIQHGEYGLYYTVTASDRYHNESVICPSAFFSHADYLK